jgi:simple sugar transport system ATP-binding protein
MVGRDLKTKTKLAPHSGKEPILSVEALCYEPDGKGIRLNNINFTLNKHEIVGIAGVSGNGQTELFETLVGMRAPSRGSIKLKNESIAGLPPAEIIDKGIGHIPADRYREGLVGELSVADNLLLGRQFSPQFSRFGFILKDRVKQFALKSISEFDIRTPSYKTPAKYLSGGNAQKIIIARELFQSSKVLLANQPTRGLDVGVIEYVYEKLLEKRKEGYGILLASEELEDLFAFTDRILVIHNGEIQGEFVTGETTIEEIGRLMAGDKQPKGEVGEAA